ncbi:MAG TPA: hypothetical protein VMB52_04990 [Verrucomicrobiae bacterium]|nr:hypothetical protein [Verrucomicrobiae bacterium]
MTTKQKALWAYLVFVALYGCGTLLLPPPKATLRMYHLSVLHLRLLDLSVIVLYAAIWWCAIYGFYSLSTYTKLIRKSKDGIALAKITTGIGFIAFWLPVSSTFSTYTDYIAQNHHSLAVPMNIAHNYLSLLLPLIGFVFISMGARTLSEIMKQRPSFKALHIMSLAIILVGVIYAHLVSTTHNRLNSVYSMSITYILITLVVPYIYMWFVGMLAVYEIYNYRAKISGAIYRQGWHMLAVGLGAIVTMSIIIQYLTTISEKLTRLSLNGLLLIVYVLLILLAVGYVCIAVGARNLKKIEEV